MSTALMVRSEKKGPVFFPDREYGNIIPHAISSLEELARNLNIPTIDSFTYMEPDLLRSAIDMVEGEKAEKLKKRLRDQLEWHSAEEGLKSIEGLKASVKDSSSRIEFRMRGPHNELVDALFQDLQDVSEILTELAKSGDRFRFEAA
ncbi:hypothetical protein L0222_07125 [bacterium]|nr:hypothetical protein [bacterium]MCI0607082.1 hypothetical protein [bacterium]